MLPEVQAYRKVRAYRNRRDCVVADIMADRKWSKVMANRFLAKRMDKVQRLVALDIYVEWSHRQGYLPDHKLDEFATTTKSLKSHCHDVPWLHDVIGLTPAQVALLASQKQWKEFASVRGVNYKLREVLFLNEKGLAAFRRARAKILKELKL